MMMFTGFFRCFVFVFGLALLTAANAQQGDSAPREPVARAAERLLGEARELQRPSGATMDYGVQARLSRVEARPLEPRLSAFSGTIETSLFETARDCRCRQRTGGERTAAV